LAYTTAMLHLNISRGDRAPASSICHEVRNELTRSGY
jgi:hypothetical protein